MKIQKSTHSLTDNDVTDNELLEFSEKLAAMDQKTFFPLITLDYQTHVEVGGEDKSSQDLLSVDDFDKLVTLHPTVKTLLPLYDNCESDALHQEDRTSQEQQEESDFIDSVLKTEVMIAAYHFLHAKGK